MILSGIGEDPARPGLVETPRRVAESFSDLVAGYGVDPVSVLEPLADDNEFQKQWREVKLANKGRLAALIAERTGIKVAPESLFDVQVKRIHEYKRQHLAALHIITLYLRLRRDPQADVPARTFIFGGKAAPGYFMAKRIIKLINSIGEIVNTDSAVRDRLKVVYFPDFNVTNAQFIYAAANLSEQISTAGKEASGTGNMKFALNGALTIGTLDGANVELKDLVGDDNIFIFGLTAQEVEASRAKGIDSTPYIEASTVLRDVLDAVGSLGRGDAELFRPIVENLLDKDPFLLLADYQPYIDAQEQVSTLWRDQRAWTRRSILNTARMGKFSSDRSIRDYCARVWNIQPTEQ